MALPFNERTQQSVFPSSAADYVIDNNGRHWVVDPGTRTRYEVTGTGARTATAELYGEPITGVYLTRWTEGQNFLSLAGGPNSIEKIIAGLRTDPISGEYVDNPRSARTASGQTFHPRASSNPPGEEPTPGTVDEHQPRDFLAEARLLYPWLPQQLIDIFTDKWAETEDPGLALAEVRRSPAYRTYFPGNRREDGSLRYDEQTYFAVITGYRKAAADVGLDPDTWSLQDLSKALENERSVAEFTDTLNAYVDSRENDVSELQTWYRENYGEDFSRNEVLQALVLDTSPREARQRLERAAIGGRAMLHGFSRDLAQVERVRQLGLSPEAANDFYGAARRTLGVLDRVSRRYSEGTVGITDLEDAGIGNDPIQQRRFERSIAAERTSMGGRQQTVRTDQESGGLTGLRQR